MKRAEAKRQDDESLARCFIEQVRRRPQRERVEAFGRAACRMIGEALQTYRIAGLGERLQELLDAQEPDDVAACEHLLGSLEPAGPMSEEIFQAKVTRAIADT